MQIPNYLGQPRVPVSKCLVSESLLLLLRWNLVNPTRKLLKQVQDSLDCLNVLLVQLTDFQALNCITNGENEP